MDESESKIFFKRSLRCLYKLYKCLGLINFTFNRATNRIVPSSEHIFIPVVGCLGFTSLAVSIAGIAGFARFYYVSKGSTLIPVEEILISTRLFYKLFNGCMFAVSFFAHRETFAETINRIIILFERVQRLTDDGRLYYPGRLRKFIVFRLVLFVLACGVQAGAFHSETARRRTVGFIWFVHSFALMELTFWAHLYGSLALMCFYQELNNLLSVVCATANDRKIKRRVSEVISISYEIHRVKQKFNTIFNSLHAVCFLGLFGDISCVYKLLKLLVVVGLNKMRVPWWMIVYLMFQIVLGGVWASYNLYLNGHIAEGLVQNERIFRRKLLTMFHANEVLRKDPDQQREIDLVLMHHNVQDLSTRSFKLFEINHSFIFAFITNVVVSYAILTLQKFASDYVMATGNRLDLLQKTVTKA